MKRYTIEHKGTYENSLYFLRVYNKNIPLVFMLDSGCSSNMIYEGSLNKCEYMELRKKTDVVIANGDTLACTTIWLDIALEPCEKPFIMSFQVSKTSFNIPFHSECVGLLGSQFLQCCRIDFRHNWIEVPTKGGVASLFKLPGILIKP